MIQLCTQYRSGACNRQAAATVDTICSRCGPGLEHLCAQHLLWWESNPRSIHCLDCQDRVTFAARPDVSPTTEASW